MGELDSQLVQPRLGVSRPVLPLTLGRRLGQVVHQPVHQVAGAGAGNG
jgi:hypothetical protein